MFHACFVIGASGHVSRQVNFLKNANTYQHHLLGVHARSLVRQLMLYGDEAQWGGLTWDEFFCFLTD